jgi:capsular polysaccharide biosynthesis protein
VSREFRRDEIAAEVTSPGFLVPQPRIWHAERIPPEPLAAMAAAWNSALFLPRPIRIAAVDRVFVLAEGLVFGEDGDPLAATIEQHSPADVEAGRELIRRGAEAGNIPHIAGEALLCRKPGASNYGHWLAELLPRIWLLGKHRSDPFPILVQHVGGPLAAVMADSLMMLGIGRERIVMSGPAPISVERLLIVDGLTHHGTYMSPLVTTCLAELTASVPLRGPERLFVTRASVASRRFAAEPGVLDRASRAGFSLLEPSALPFRAQVAAFRAADCVAGAVGAGLANLLFARSGSRAYAFAPASMPDTFFWFIAGHRGLDLSDIRCESAGPPRGPAPWDGDLVLDEADFAAMTEEAAQPAQPRRPAAEAFERLVSLFDASFYHAQNPDVAEAGGDPFLHYMHHGGFEGRDPCPRFSSSLYLERNPDVAAAGVHPLVHYVLHGEIENREAPEAVR